MLHLPADFRLNVQADAAQHGREVERLTEALDEARGDLRAAKRSAEEKLGEQRVAAEAEARAKEDRRGWRRSLVFAMIGVASIQVLLPNAHQPFDHLRIAFYGFVW